MGERVGEVGFMFVDMMGGWMDGCSKTLITIVDASASAKTRPT
jgi:hypothetical protein